MSSPGFARLIQEWIRLIRKIRNILLFNDFSRSDLKAVQQLIMEDNRKFCIVWAAVNSLFWVYCLIMTFVNPDYRMCRVIYIAGFAVCVVCLCLSVYVAPKHSGLIRAIAIMMDESLLLAGIFIARYLAPQTIVVFASVLIVPVVFITDTFSTVLMLFVNIIVFTQVGSRTMVPDTYRWVLSNLIIFSAVGVLIGHFVNKGRFERYIFAESKAELAKIQAGYAYHDQLTELQNRRAFEETIGQLAKALPAGCSVVVVDINGLKETNDTRGHAAGDELIIGTAKSLCRSFMGIDRIYRIGGDEFVVIVTEEHYDVDEALNRLKRYSANWKGELIHGVSISAGVASAKEFDSMDAMLKAADQRMYESKREYYQSTGKDRRRR